MQLWLDNAAAAIVFGVMVLMMMSVQSRTQQATLEQASFYALRSQQVNLIQTLERDLHNAYRLDDFGISGTDSLFDFRTTLSSSNVDTVRVRYRLRRSGSTASVPLYTLDRYERATSGTYVRQGGSPSYVTEFQIQVQNADEQPTNNLTDARQVRLSFELMTPWRAHLDRSATVERVRWQATYRPLVLHKLPRL